MKHTLIKNQWIVKTWPILLAGTLIFTLLIRPQWFGAPEDFWELFTNQEKMQVFINGYGFWSPFIFAFVQASQVVLAPIPGEFTGAIGGMMFGGAAGCVYASIGLMIGSSVAFLLGRYGAKPLVDALIGKKRFADVTWIHNFQSPSMILLIFAVPGLPKDIMTYAYALSPIGFWRFFILSQLGRLPGTLLLTYSGSSLFEQNWRQLAILASGAVLLFAVTFWVRQSIQEKK